MNTVSGVIYEGEYTALLTFLEDTTRIVILNQSTGEIIYNKDYSGGYIGALDFGEAFEEAEWLIRKAIVRK